MRLGGCGGSYTTLFGLAMLGVLPTPRTELLERQTIEIVALVFLGVRVALAAIRARQGDQDAICFLGHLRFCLLKYSL